MFKIILLRRKLYLIIPIKKEYWGAPFFSPYFSCKCFIILFIINMLQSKDKRLTDISITDVIKKYLIIFQKLAMVRFSISSS